MSSPHAYEIHPTADHLIDMTYDVSLIRSGNADYERVFFAETARIASPEPLQFVANFDALKGRDFPVPEPIDFPIMSRRMLEILRTVGPFEHRALTCVMIDDTVMPAERYDDRGLRHDIVDDRYVAVHLTTHVADAFDWERSKYERDDDEPERLLVLEKLVLKEAPLPPLFRLAPYPRVLFVSAEAKAALEGERVRGVHFVPDRFVV